MIEFGMYTQTRGACNNCKGKGMAEKDSDKCSKCKGDWVNQIEFTMIKEWQKGKDIHLMKSKIKFQDAISQAMWFLKFRRTFNA